MKTSFAALLRIDAVLDEAHQPRDVRGPHLGLARGATLAAPSSRRRSFAIQLPAAWGLPRAFAASSKKSARSAVRDEDGGDRVGDSVLPESSLRCLSNGQLGAGGADLGLPGLVHLDRHQVRVREIPVVVGHLLRAEGLRGPRLAVVVAGLLDDLAPGHARPPVWRLDLVGDAVAHERDRVQVLELDLRPESRLADGPDRDVGVAAQLALLHVAVRDPAVDHDGLQRRQVGEGLVGAADHGLRDDLHQRRARPVEVDERVPVAVVQLAHVLLEVDAGERDRPVLAHDVARRAGQLDLDLAPPAERLVVLGDLVVLGRVRVEVVLPVPLADGRDLAAEEEARP